MLLDPSKCSLLIVDVQEKLFKKIFNYKSIESYIDNAIYIFSTLKLPIVYSEQYPKGLGTTVKKIKERLSSTPSTKFEKTEFSCFSEKKEANKAKKFIKTKQVVVCGIETHICVLQTVLDLKKLGYEVFVINEAIGSRKKEDKELAIKRLYQTGVYVINFEMLLFELIRDSKHKNFKELSKILK